jgi:hypothetical protein
MWLPTSAFKNLNVMVSCLKTPTLPTFLGLHNGCENGLGGEIDLGKRRHTSAIGPNCAISQAFPRPTLVPTWGRQWPTSLDARTRRPTRIRPLKFQFSPIERASKRLGRHQSGGAAPEDGRAGRGSGRMGAVAWSPQRSSLARAHSSWFSRETSRRSSRSSLSG